MTTSHLDPQAVHERVGFVGMGTMGAAMALNLAKAGFALTVWNRTPGARPRLWPPVPSRSPQRRNWPPRPTSSSCVSPTRPGRGGAVRRDGSGQRPRPGLDCRRLHHSQSAQGTRVRDATSHARGERRRRARVGRFRGRAARNAHIMVAVRTRTSLESIPFCERWASPSTISVRSERVSGPRPSTRSFSRRLPRGGGRSHARVEGGP